MTQIYRTRKNVSSKMDGIPGRSLYSGLAFEEIGASAGLLYRICSIQFDSQTSLEYDRLNQTVNRLRCHRVVGYEEKVKWK